MFAPSYILWKYLTNKYGESEPSAFPNYLNLPPNVKFEIALQSDFKTLENSCLTNREYQDICNNDYFWKKKTYYDFGDLYDIEKIEDKWRDNYQRYRRRFTKAFIETIKYMDLSLIKVLLNINNKKQFLILDGQDNRGLTPLMWASRGGRTEIVRLLLDAGADPNIQMHGGMGMTALMWASRRGHTEIARLLLDAGADLNIKDDLGWTVLMLASVWGHTETVRLLLDAGADPNIQHNSGLTALMWVGKGHRHLYNYRAPLDAGAKIARALLEAGADPDIQDDDGNTALIHATAELQVKIVQLLLEYGADTNLQNIHGSTALDLALSKGHNKIVDLINDYNSFINRFRRAGNKFLRVGEEVADIYGGYGDY